MDSTGHFPLPCAENPAETLMHPAGVAMRNYQTGAVLYVDKRPCIMYPSLDQAGVPVKD